MASMIASTMIELMDETEEAAVIVRMRLSSAVTASAVTLVRFESMDQMALTAEMDSM